MFLRRTGHRARARARSRAARLALVAILAGVPGCAYLTPLEQEPGGVRGFVSGRHEAGALVAYLEPSSRFLDLGFAAAPKAIDVREGRLAKDVHVAPGSAFYFRNQDATHHELFTAADENQFQSNVPGGGTSESLRLPRPGLVRIFCRLHPSETAVLLVAPTEHHVWVGPSNRFELAGVRPGRYRLRVLGDSVTSEPVEVRVAPGDTLDVDRVIVR